MSIVPLVLSHTAHDTTGALQNAAVPCTDSSLLCPTRVLYCCIDTSAALPRLPFTGIQAPRATSGRPAKTSWALTAAPGNEQGSPEETLNEPSFFPLCSGDQQLVEQSSP